MVKGERRRQAGEQSFEKSLQIIIYIKFSGDIAWLQENPEVHPTILQAYWGDCGGVIKGGGGEVEPGEIRLLSQY